MESQKLKTQKLKCYVLGPKSQKFPTAENTRYTVYSYVSSINFFPYDLVAIFDLGRALPVFVLHV